MDRWIDYVDIMDIFKIIAPSQIDWICGVAPLNECTSLLLLTDSKVPISISPNVSGVTGIIITDIKSFTLATAPIQSIIQFKISKYGWPLNYSHTVNNLSSFLMANQFYKTN